MFARRPHTLLTLALAAALSACDNSSHEKLLAEARAYQDKHDLNAAIIVLKNAAEKSPGDAETRKLLAVVHNEGGDGASAEKEIRRAIEAGTPLHAAMPVLARALLNQSKYQQAINESEQAAAAGTPDLLVARGDARVALGQPDAARTEYQAVLAKQPKHTAALIGMARAASAEHDSAGAQRFADEALAAAPNDTDALQFKADLLRAENRNAQATALYDKILQLNPRHRLAWFGKTYAAVAEGKFDEAQSFLNSARAITPGSLLVVYTQALLEFSRGRYPAALEGLQMVLSAAPDHMPSLLLAGAVNLNLGSLHQAENYLRQYLEKNPSNEYARKMLATTLLRSGHSPDALNVLAPALENKEKDVQLLALAGESYMQVRDFARASEFFQQAAALDPNAANLRTSLGLSKLGEGQHAQAIEELRNAAKLDTESPYAGIALVRTEIGLGHYDRALGAAEDMERAQPQNAVVQELKGLVYRAQEKPDLARRSFEKALQLQPSHFPAAAALAQMEMAAKKPEAARACLLAFLEKNKSSTDAMTALAALASADGKVADATQWLEKAVAAAPDAVAPNVRLITQYLVTGDKQKALTLARKIQLAHRENPDLLDLLGKSQLANGERSEALESYRKLAVALPRSANAQMQVAALQILMGKHLAAEDTLKTVLAMQPDFPAAQLAQAELYVRRGSHDLALMTASRLQRNYPKASAGYQLEGDILISQNKPALALASYEKAYAITKSTELMIKYVNAMRAAGRQQDAGRMLAQWLSTHPDDVRAQLYKAETLLADKQYRQAAEHLSLTLQREPKNVTALNNLAWAYQQAGDARALAAAEEAYRVAGEQPVIMDTLGWILVEKGEAARGVQILQKASIQAPQARDIRYHMAVGLLKTGDKAGARKELQQLMSGDTRFAQADEARALLQKLQ